jgi:glycosyltransferase involved in cell wall biosynthesis
MLPPEGTAFRDWAVRAYERSREDIDLAVVTNPTLRAFLVKSCGFPRARIVELHNPVDFVAWHGPRPGRRDDVIEIAMVAQWRAQKDHLTAIRATRLLLDRGLTVRLTFVGSEDSDLTAAGQALASDLGLDGAVRFLGRRTDVPDILASSDVGLLTTHFEGLPVAVVEYCAAGLPSVVSAVEGTTHLISSENGIVGVRPSDPGAVAEAVADLRSAGRRHELGFRARDFMQARADRGVVLDTIVDHYDRLGRGVPST